MTAAPTGLDVPPEARAAHATGAEAAPAWPAPHPARRLAAEAAKLALGGAARAAALAARRPPRVVVYYNWRDFARKAEGFADLLRHRGFPVELRTGASLYDRARIKYSRDLHIGFWNHYHLHDLPARYIFYNAEPLSLPKWQADVEWQDGLRRATEVWGYAANHAPLVARYGVPYRFIPFGYAPYYEEVFRAAVGANPAPPDVDVLFVGRVSPRREAVLQALRDRGLHVVTVTYQNPLQGAALDRMVARAKVVLTLFHYDEPGSQVVDLSRLDHILANGRFVVHERPPEENRDPEFEAHVPTVPYAALADTCARYARDHAERARLAREAHAWFRRERALDTRLPYDELRRLMG